MPLNARMCICFSFKSLVLIVIIAYKIAQRSVERSLHYGRVPRPEAPPVDPRRRQLCRVQHGSGHRHLQASQGKGRQSILP